MDIQSYHTTIFQIFYVEILPQIGQISPGYLGEKSYLAAVIGYDGATGLALCEQRNKCAVGDEVEVLSPGQFGRAFSVAALFDENGDPIDSTPHPGMRFRLPVPFPVSAGDLLRRHEASAD